MYRTVPFNIYNLWTKYGGKQTIFTLCWYINDNRKWLMRELRQLPIPQDANISLCTQATLHLRWTFPTYGPNPNCGWVKIGLNWLRDVTGVVKFWNFWNLNIIIEFPVWKLVRIQIFVFLFKFLQELLTFALF